jgi:hypothetical protein
MTTKDWTPVMEKTSCEDKFQLFLSELEKALHIYLPEKTVTIHQNDRPWMTKELLSGCLTKNHAERFRLKIRYALYFYHELPLS